MFNLIAADLFKLRKLIAVKVSILSCMISAASLTIMSYGISKGFISEAISGDLSGLTEIMMISLFGSLMAGVVICQDFEDKSMHHVISAGVGRSTIVRSKFITFGLMIAILLLPYLLTTLVAMIIGVSLPDKIVVSTFLKCLADANGQAISGVQIGKLVIIYIATVVVYVARLSICIPFALIIKKQIFVMIGGFAGCGLIDIVVGLLGELPIFSILLGYTPYSRIYMILGLETNIAVLIKAIIVNLIFIFIMGVISCKIFKRVEVK